MAKYHIKLCIETHACFVKNTGSSRRIVIYSYHIPLNIKFKWYTDEMWSAYSIVPREVSFRNTPSGENEVMSK